MSFADGSESREVIDHLCVDQVMHSKDRLHRILAAIVAALAIGGVAVGAPWTGDIPTLAGHVTSVHDGDTFRIGATTIRVYGIDAPELATPYGPSAQSVLVRAIDGGAVRCIDTGSRSYDRIVASCVNHRGHDIAAIVVRSGWAVDWWRFSCGRYLTDQQDAQDARRGMFAYGVRPWHPRPRHARHCGA